MDDWKSSVTLIDALSIVGFVDSAVVTDSPIDQFSPLHRKMRGRHKSQWAAAARLTTTVQLTTSRPSHTGARELVSHPATGTAPSKLNIATQTPSCRERRTG